ncbi:MAG: ABC transporter ATP-binding protein [Thermaerobacter sp.]|nr:ABC transporter ATP-binding protein [Thermaerobacter sp.]
MSGRRPLTDLWQAVRPDRQTLAAATALTLARAGTDVLTPWPLKIAADSVLGTHPGPGWLPSQPAVALGLLACLMLVFAGTGFTLAAAAARRWAAISQNATFRLRTALLNRMLKSRVGAVESRPSGEWVARLAGDTSRVGSGLVQAAGELATAITTLGALLAIITWLLPAAGLLATMAIAVFGTYVGWRSRHVRQAVRQARRADSRLLSLALEALREIRQVLALRADGHMRRHYRTLARQSREANRTAAELALTLGPAASLFGMTMVAGILWMGGRAVLQHHLTVGGWVVLVAYMRSLVAPSRSLAKLAGQISAAWVSLDRLGELYALPLTASPRASCPMTRGALSLAQVSFAYGPGEPVLRNVSLTLDPGQRVAIVGPSGVGKSTLVALLLGFYLPDSGRITLDGLDLRDWPPKMLRAQLGWVRQDPHLLAGSVLDNMTLGIPRARREDVLALIEQLELGPVFSRLAAGLETPVQEGGANLSGGQRQAVSLIRVMLRNPPVLLLDEPAAALDLPTQHQLLESLARIIENRTTLIITHHPAPLRLASRIYRLEAGHLILKTPETAARFREGRGLGETDAPAPEGGPRYPFAPECVQRHPAASPRPTQTL